MRNILATTIVVALAWLVPLPAQTPGTTLYEGARVIDGTGAAPIDKGAIVVSNGRIVAVGRAGQVSSPAGSTRVDLSGKTVMPTIVDTHTHPATAHDQLVEQLRAKAYFGVSAIQSMGLDNTDAAFTVRSETIPGAARLLHRRPRHHRAGAGPNRRAVLGDHRGRSAKGRPGARRQEGRHGENLGRRSRSAGTRSSHQSSTAPVIDEAHKHKLRVAAHIFALEDAKGCSRPASTLRSRGPRQGRGRRVRRDGEGPPQRRADPEHARSRCPDRFRAGCRGAFPLASFRSCRPTRSPVQTCRPRGRFRGGTWRS